MAVGNFLLERFSGKFRRCWKIPHRFSGSTKCYPCQGLGTFRQGKRLLENWPRLRERCWIFCSETATAFLSSSECNHFGPNTHLFSRARKKGFSFFFLWGDPVQNRPQNPAPARCLFSTRKSRSEVTERGDFGEENCVGKCGADRAKKGKKDAQKKVGTIINSCPAIESVTFQT